MMHLDALLSQQAKSTPHMPALSMLGEEITYQQLDSRVTARAVQLLALGVETGDRVAICAAKGAEAIIAIYAVLRVGAVYVPLDPQSPENRVLEQLARLDVGLVLADARSAPKFEGESRRVERLDASLPEPNGQDLAHLADRQADRRADDLAYVFMTSGTTGTPKGIVHSHKSGMAYARMAAKLCALSPADRVSHHTPTHFDMSIFDLFSTCVAGACVVVIPEMYAKLPASLSQLAEQERITIWYSVPFALTQLIDRGALELRDLSSLRVIMFAGEMMPPATAKALADRWPQARLLNAYGPTETNHCVTADLDHQELDGVSPLPIGLPDEGVLMQLGELGQDAAEGELLIASNQVMRGYWQDEPRNDSAFVDLHGPDGGLQRFYRTGDMVQRRSDGQLMLVGRKDRQIKIRGFRVELDEVELALLNQPGVTEAVADFDQSEIRAFVSGSQSLNVDTLKTGCATVLPPYAVPTHIIRLKRLPRTSTGKIDRKTLTGKKHDHRAA